MKKFINTFLILSLFFTPCYAHKHDKLKRLPHSQQKDSSNEFMLKSPAHYPRLDWVRKHPWQTVAGFFLVGASGAFTASMWEKHPALSTSSMVPLSIPSLVPCSVEKGLLDSIHPTSHPCVDDFGAILCKRLAVNGPVIPQYNALNTYMAITACDYNEHPLGWENRMQKWVFLPNFFIPEEFYDRNAIIVKEGQVKVSNKPNGDKLITGHISNCVAVVATNAEESMLAHIYFSDKTMKALQTSEEMVWQTIVSFSQRHSKTSIILIGGNVITLELANKYLESLGVNINSIKFKKIWGLEKNNNNKHPKRGAVGVMNGKIYIAEYKENEKLALRFPSLSPDEKDLIEIF